MFVGSCVGGVGCGGDCACRQGEFYRLVDVVEMVVVVVAIAGVDVEHNTKRPKCFSGYYNTELLLLLLMLLFLLLMLYGRCYRFGGYRPIYTSRSKSIYPSSLVRQQQYDGRGFGRSGQSASAAAFRAATRRGWVARGAPATSRVVPPGAW